MPGFETDLETRQRQDAERAEENHAHMLRVNPVPEEDGDVVTPPDPLVWHEVVGGVGLLHGWVVQASPYGPPAYALDEINNIIHFRGGLNGSSATNEVIFIVPVGFRPAYTRTASIFNATYFGLRPNGECYSFAGATYIILDGTTFSL